MHPHPYPHQPCVHLGRKIGTLTTGGVSYDHHRCNVAVSPDGTCYPSQPAWAQKPGHSCAACPLRSTVVIPRVDVVVTSHNYGGFLRDALESVSRQDSRTLGRVVVVDDSSDTGDTTREVCEQFEFVEYLRVEVRSPHLARSAGFARCSAPLVHFLDADNVLPDGYLQAAAEIFAANHRVAIVYPDLQYFGDSTELRSVPAVLDVAQLERMNYIDTGSVWLREALEQVGAFSRDREPAGWEDWRVARDILRSGRWEAVHHPIPLRYRRHAEQRIVRFRDRSYFDTAGLADETVTVFTTFSDRIQKSPELWERRKAWLRQQTWPTHQIRLVVANTSHKPLPAGWQDGLPDSLQGVSVYSHPVGFPGLEDKNRMNNQPVENAVSTAVAAIYNRMWQETQTEFVLILEDDVFPTPLDAIEKMLRAFATNTAAVTGAYRQRYWPYAITAFNRQPHNGRPILRLHGPAEGVEEIGGAGFGCLMVRRSQMADEVIVANTTGPSGGPYYDVNLFGTITQKGRGVRMAWGVYCDHLGPQMPPMKPRTPPLTVVLPTIGRPTLRDTLRSLQGQLASTDEVWLVSDGPASAELRKLWYDFNHMGRLIEISDGPHGDWGHTPRNRVLAEIPADRYVIAIDDDDTLAVGALDAVRLSITAHPGDLFLLQMRRSDGSIIPDPARGNVVECGNVGTPMFVHPGGIPLGQYGTIREGDFQFISQTIARNQNRRLHWVPSVIVDIRPQGGPVHPASLPLPLPVTSGPIATAEPATGSTSGFTRRRSSTQSASSADSAAVTILGRQRSKRQRLPSLWIRGWNFAMSLGRWIAAGAPCRSKEEIAERLAICQRCPHLDASHCNLCGCACVESNRLINKLALKTERCPAGKWE